ncbi:MAG: exodeoxyribonuclease VII small subunit [Bacillota bacterium]|nr:exodeoxyribonuclease VII small subunit [Bacillota bacterium]
MTQEASLTFEKALEELERIVRRLEEGQVSLEESLAAFERGLELLAFCQARLSQVEKRVEVLVERAGTLDLDPFADIEEERA